MTFPSLSAYRKFGIVCVFICLSCTYFNLFSTEGHSRVNPNIDYCSESIRLWDAVYEKAPEELNEVFMFRYRMSYETWRSSFTDKMLEK